jgi:hypothetical protein
MYSQKDTANYLPTIHRVYNIFQTDTKENAVLHILTTKEYNKRCDVKKEKIEYGLTKNFIPSISKEYYYNSRNLVKKIVLNTLIPECHGFVKTNKIRIRYDKNQNIKFQKNKLFKKYSLKKLHPSLYSNFRKKYNYNKYNELTQVITKVWDTTSKNFKLTKKTEVIWQNHYPIKIVNYNYTNSWQESSSYDSIVWVENFTLPKHKEIDSLEKNKGIHSYILRDNQDKSSHRYRIHNIQSDSLFVIQTDSLTDNGAWILNKKTEVKLDIKNNTEMYADFQYQNDSWIEIQRKEIITKLDKDSNQPKSKVIKLITKGKVVKLNRIEQDAFINCSCIKKNKI